MKDSGLSMDFLTRLSKAIATQFGSDCEVTIHDFSEDGEESEILVIWNGHVTHRKLGDGPSHIVLEALKNRDSQPLEDQLDYLTQTDDGRILKSSSVFIRDEKGALSGLFCINYDITRLIASDNAIKSFLHLEEEAEDEAPTKISKNVDELLDELIQESVKLVGKPVALMSRDEKKKAIQFLDKQGAFLITKSGDRVSNHFGISKYTLYNYIDSDKN